MTKKFFIKELAMLDENGCEKIKLNPLKEYEIPSLANEEEIRGGYGQLKEND